MQYPQRNHFEMAAHEVQHESVGSLMTTINKQVEELKKLINA